MENKIKTLNIYKMSLKKRKKLKNEIYHSIRNDVEFRQTISKSLGIAEYSVYIYAVRKAPTLQKPMVLSVIKKYLGLKEHELFED